MNRLERNRLIMTALSLCIMAITVRLFAETKETTIEEDWTRLEKKILGDFDTYEKDESAKWEIVKKRVMLKWENPELPETTKYVEYFDDDTARLKVDYDAGIVTVEALASEQSPEPNIEAKKQIENVIKIALEAGINKNPILFSEEIIGSKDAKTLANEIPIRFKEEIGTDGKKRKGFQITFSLIPNFVRKRAAKFFPIVKLWSDKYKLEPALVLAIIRQESAFNPRARSWVPALGLMQIVPHYAGKEVMAAVTKKDIVPTSDFLYDPAWNIMLGTTYLQILRDRYFGDITVEAKRTLLMIASYNWGPNRVQDLITKERILASSSAIDIYKDLIDSAPAETKDYIRKVIQYRKEFRSILDREGSL